MLSNFRIQQSNPILSVHILLHIFIGRGREGSQIHATEQDAFSLSYDIKFQKFLLLHKIFRAHHIENSRAAIKNLKYRTVSQYYYKKISQLNKSISYRQWLFFLLFLLNFYTQEICHSHLIHSRGNYQIQT